MAEGLSLREFGNQIGVTGEAVRKAIASGKIPADCVGQKLVGKDKIHPTIINPKRAAEHWGRERNQNQVRDKAALAAGAKRGWAQRRNEDPPDDDDPDDDAPTALSGAGTRDKNGPSYNDIRKVTESYKAKLARLDYEKAIGKLVDAEQTTLTYTNLITSLRNRLRGVPSSAKGRMPHLTVYDIEILEELIDQALNETADEDIDDEG